MFLYGVVGLLVQFSVFLLTSTDDIDVPINCPYTPLLSAYWRMIALRCHQNARRELTAGYTPDLPPAKDVYELAWNCETEYNLNKIREELQDSRNTAEYRNFGVNVGSNAYCGFSSLISMITNWFYNEYPNALPSMKYEGKNDSLHFANMAKWNATETACSFGSYDNGNSAMMICAYNVKGAVVGETIYEIAKAGEYPCKEGTECGTDGKCVNGLCKVPIGIHDTLLPIFKPTLSCKSLPYMSQFSRYYALNLHNYYRSLVATGWAENKLTLFTPRAAKMEALTRHRTLTASTSTSVTQSYDCQLEEAANENAKKCEGAEMISKYSGTNVEVINDVNITREAALERAVTGWFNLLRRFDMDPNTTWEDIQSVWSSANMLHDKYNVVGCAVNICSTKGITIVDCRYGLKRPQNGDKIYEVGAPCSGCTAGQECIYGGLCK